MYLLPLHIYFQHPNIHEIKEVAVERIDKIGADIVVVIQRKSPEGSLRDIIRCREEVRIAVFIGWVVE